VGIDRPDDAELPDRHLVDATGRRGAPGGDVQAEARSREEYHADLRAAVAAWDESIPRFRGLWAEYRRRWPAEERPPADRPADPPGSWRGDGNRFLDRAASEQTDRECDRIAVRERDRISPALREIESRDPDRRLVGFEYRLKGRDRIKEKVADIIRVPGRSPGEAISDVPDAVRYTFQYPEDRYTQGVRADLERLEEHGFRLVERRNTWSDDHYKGINSRWTDSETGQRFEVQFHTRVSFEAKQLTHGAYERLRSGLADDFETMVLKAFQREVTSEVLVPPGAADIPDYPERGQEHAR
jgi:hypothetical protein